MKKALLLFFLILEVFSTNVFSQDQTVGLFKYEQGTMEGYVFYTSLFSQKTYLIDNCGRQVKKWSSEYSPSVQTILLENGHLLRAVSSGLLSNPVFIFGGAGEKIEEVDWDGNVLWEFTYSDTLHRLHHDFVQLPNGNVLMIAWELKSGAEAIEAGRDTSLLPHGVLWGETIIEVEPATGEIVWEWHVWDHMIQDYDETKNNFGIVAEHPELININVTGATTADGGRNWLHFNSIDYNPMMDQIMVNSFFTSELFIIDHSTTREEAAGHSGGNSTRGGDLLYRWGNPQNYDHGTEADHRIFGAHNPHWIPGGLEDAGKIMFFNNGRGRPGGPPYSSVDIITPPVDNYGTGEYIYTPGVAYGPVEAEWSYVADPPTSFFSSFLSSAQRLQNGNTLVCSGAKGRFFEVTPDDEVVWEYINPAINNGSVITQGDTIPVLNGRNANMVFRARRYPANFPGFEGKDLTPGDPIELGFPEPYDCTIIDEVTEEQVQNISIFPNPASRLLHIQAPDITMAEVAVFDMLGRQMTVGSLVDGVLDVDVSRYAKGVYFVAIDGVFLEKVVVE